MTTVFAAPPQALIPRADEVLLDSSVRGEADGNFDVVAAEQTANARNLLSCDGHFRIPAVGYDAAVAKDRYIRALLGTESRLPMT